ncbi:MAG: helix-turn-helix transcriptional regulator [Chlamydiota bacterium]
MSVLTKTRRTRLTRKKAITSRPKKPEASIPWREVAKANIKKYSETGLALRGARFRAELTQKQLAVKLKVLPHHISEMEHGKRPISKKMAQKLSKILNIDYRVFL